MAGSCSAKWVGIIDSGVSNSSPTSGVMQKHFGFSVSP